MSIKVKRYGWRYTIPGTDKTDTREYGTMQERDADNLARDGYRKYTVTRTVRAKGRPLWWAIRQLQEGRTVWDGDGEQWDPTELHRLLDRCAKELPSWAHHWTLAEVQP